METEKTVPELLHDIRSSLGVIQSNAELSGMNPELPADVAKSMEEIVLQVGQIARIVSNVSAHFLNKG